MITKLPVAVNNQMLVSKINDIIDAVNKLQDEFDIYFPEIDEPEAQEENEA
jgi:hypothetical protein